MKNYAKNKKKNWKKISKETHDAAFDAIEVENIEKEASEFIISRKQLPKSAIIKGDKNNAKLCSSHSNLTFTEETSLRRLRAGRIRKRLRPDQCSRFYKDAIPDDLWSDNKDQIPKKITVKKPPPSKYRATKSSIPAVAVPHAGISYNPSFLDHQNLLAKHESSEKLKMKRENKIFRQLEAHFPNTDGLSNEQRYLKEISAGIFEESEPEEVEDVITQPEEVTSVMPHNAPKSKKAKQNQLEAAKAVLKKKAQKKFDNDINNIPRLVKEVKHTDEVHSRIREEKHKLKTAEPEHVDLDQEPFQMVADLRGSLRQLKPEGDLLIQQMNSLRRRGIIEKPIIKTKKRQIYRYKHFERK